MSYDIPCLVLRGVAVASQLADRKEIHVRSITGMHGSSEHRCQEKHRNQKNAHLTIDKEYDLNQHTDRTLFQQYKSCLSSVAGPESRQTHSNMPFKIILVAQTAKLDQLHISSSILGVV